MKSFRIFTLRKIALVVTLIFTQVLAPIAFAKSPVKMKNLIGSIDIAEENPVPFTLAGTASHLGKFTAAGEVEFAPGEEEGSLVGVGVVVFEAANGDLLVGNVTWDVDPVVNDFSTSAIHFIWADSVEFSNGDVVFNTGRFVDDRPPGLVVIAIIAVLIGLLLPAVQ
jgi:hypothetical protein